MPKTQVKTHDQELIPNLVYDSFNDSIWEMDGFFEILNEYYEGSPVKMAEELVQIALQVSKLMDLTTAPDLLVVVSDLLTLREAVKGILKDEN